MSVTQVQSRLSMTKEGRVSCNKPGEASTNTTESIYIRDFDYHEMLRKTRQGNTTQQKDKATQQNSPKAVIFSKKN